MTDERMVTADEVREKRPGNREEIEKIKSKIRSVLDAPECFERIEELINQEWKDAHAGHTYGGILVDHIVTAEGLEEDTFITVVRCTAVMSYRGGRPDAPEIWYRLYETHFTADGGGVERLSGPDRLSGE